ncbi:MAG TPA: flagellar hook-associated protein FlgK [Hyphomicrobiaceae bacterium]|nr:flagellar hook-associated protein FlgK [Hyphomicrobiaceae bacterium]
MTLSAGLEVARSGLAVTAGQTAVVSRNVANVGNPLASRKIANVVTSPSGGVALASITRVTNQALFDNLLAATSASNAQQAIMAALDRLDQTINDPELDASPAALVGKLADAIQQYASGPHDGTRAQSAVMAASRLAQALNSATRTVQDVRAQADADIANSVERLNALLAQFETINTEIVKGTRAGADITDYLDARDRTLAAISEEVGVRTITRADNDMVVFTDSGVTLFETRARTVTFAPTLIYSATTVGNPVYVDGVPITGSGSMAIGTGRLTGLVSVRDDAAVTYQRQLDEIARGLIEIFAESDQSAVPALPDATGLFTWPGGPAVPPAGVVVDGLAGVIALAASVDPLQGGNPALLRDGGIAGPAYVYNTTGAAGFVDRLQEILDRFAEPRAFDPSSNIDPLATIGGFGAASAAWLQEARRSAAAEVEYRTTLLERSAEALSKETGVNLDEEMTRLLELERAYQASSKLISTIDTMLGSLIAAIR